MKWGTAVLATSGLILSIALVWGSTELTQASTVLPGVKVGGVPVGGLTGSQAAARLQERLGQLQGRFVTVKVAGTPVSSTAAALGWRPDFQRSAKASKSFGRGGAPWTLISARLDASRGQVNLPVNATVNIADTRLELKRLAVVFERRAVASSIGFEGRQYVLRRGIHGLSANIEAAVDAFQADPSAATLDVSLAPTGATLTNAILARVVAQANRLVRPLRLNYTSPHGPVKSLTLTPMQVANLYYARPHGVDLDPNTIATTVKTLGDSFDRPARDAKLAVRKGRTTVLSEQSGWGLDATAATAVLGVAVLDPQAVSVTMPVTVALPAVRASDLPDPTALKVIASATTRYKGSSPERAANVEIAAARLDGTVVTNGEVFSFNEAIGKIAPENGFQSGLIISNGRTVAGLGGGVCQVSTTTFRALYRGGLPIVERNQHAYLVHWYDPEIGFDAAVYQPVLDLKMLNDTGAPILVRAATNHAAGTVTVQVLGLRPQRKVIISAATVISRTPHPPAALQPDASLSAGVRRQVDWAADGYHTVITRKVFQDGAIRKDALETTYQPWRAVYLVGTGPKP